MALSLYASLTYIDYLENFKLSQLNYYLTRMEVERRRFVLLSGTLIVITLLVLSLSIGNLVYTMNYGYGGINVGKVQYLIDELVSQPGKYRSVCFNLSYLNE